MNTLKREQIDDIIERALAEDTPDVTTEAIFEKRERATAHFLAKESGTVAGWPFVRATFAALDSDSELDIIRGDGERIEAGETIARVASSVRALLTGERTALNLLQRASGIATATRRCVDAVAGTRARIYDTRKTAPGLRALDKYAVRAGGGENHRYGLFDMVLIKNNHIDRSGSITAAVERVRAAGRTEPIMVEVRDRQELVEALATDPDFILLDNMTPGELKAAVELTAGRVPLEASGGITMDTIRAVAESGVDRISIGALTHSVKAMDISMRID